MRYCCLFRKPRSLRWPADSMRSLIDNSPTRLAIRPEAVALAVVAALAAGAIALSVNANDAESATGDNVVFILTDDQAVQRARRRCRTCSR